MSNQMTEAMKSAKTIQTEMVQWENRVESEKQNYGNLKRQSEILQQEIDAKRTEYSNYISVKEKQLRDGLDKLLQDQKVLESQRNEFKDILDVHQKDKQALAQDKLLFERDKSVLAGQKQLVNDFIQAVRRAYNLIAE